MNVKRASLHLILPAVLAIIFFMIVATPVEVFGCRNRGLLALLIALMSGLAALASAFKGATGRKRGDRYTLWWVASSLILVIPVVALVILA
jgi:hypothetical protein